MAGRAAKAVQTLALLLIGAAGCSCLAIAASAPACAQTVIGPDTLNTGDTIAVTGDNVPALLADGAGNDIVVLGGGGITATNLAGTGTGVITALNGGKIDLGTGTIVQAQGSGSAPGVIGASGLFAKVAGATITARDLIVIATSDKPYGVHAREDGIIILTGLTTITTSSNGPEGWGLVTDLNGKITAENVTITMGGTGQTQVPISAFRGGQTTVTGNAVFDATGMFVDGIAAIQGGVVTLNTITGNVVSVGAGGFGAGAAAEGAGTVTVSGNAQLTVSAANEGYGAQVLGGGHVALVGSSNTIVVTAPAAFGLFAGDGGTLTLSNAVVSVDGATATAIRSEATAAGTLTTIDVANSTLTSSGVGIVIRGGTTDLTFTGVTLVNGSGLAIDVGANGGTPGVLNFFADSSLLTGIATAAAGSTSNVTLTNGTVWTVTGNSNVTSLTNAGSLIQFTPPVGGAFKTLTTVNYAGANGTLGLNTFLGQDGSPSDLLIINGGTATGSTILRIANAGGPGALTAGSGILVVDAINGATTAPGAFALAGPVLVGPYEYKLFRGDGDPEDWYLRSSYRQEVSLYAAVPALALLYGRALMDTMHERIGGDVNLPGGTNLASIAYGTGIATAYAGAGGPGVAPGAYPQPGPAGHLNGAWGRVIAQTGEQDGDPKGVFGAGPRYGYDVTAIQAGLDVFRWQEAGGLRTHAGLYGALGDVRSGVTHVDGTFAGRDTFAAYSIGGYWTYFGRPGWYLDSVVQGTWYDAKAQSTRMPALETDGWGFAGSLEGGHPFRLAGGWIVEPQAQLVYQSVDLNAARDIVAPVRFDDAESLAGRIGVRFVTSWTSWPLPGPVLAWMRPSLWQEFLGDPKTLFPSGGGFIPFRADLGEAWAEINAGIAARLDRTTTLYASATYEAGLEGRSEAWDGKIGLRVNW